MSLGKDATEPTALKLSMKRFYIAVLAVSFSVLFAGLWTFFQRFSFVSLVLVVIFWNLYMRSPDE